MTVPNRDWKWQAVALFDLVILFGLVSGIPRIELLRSPSTGTIHVPVIDSVARPNCFPLPAHPLALCVVCQPFHEGVSVCNLSNMSADPFPLTNSMNSV